MLTLEEGTVLVGIARKAIESHLSARPPQPHTTSSRSLRELKGVFVTLLDISIDRSLRGCIGSPFPDKPLIDLTVASAIEAATMDPRFSPMKQEDMAHTIVEITVLSPIEPIEARTPAELPSKIVTGLHGIVVDGFGARGLLLPQVALDERFDSEEFISQCCMKAGLLPDAWLTGNVQVSRFEAQIFSEEEPRGAVLERELHRTRHD